MTHPIDKSDIPANLLVFQPDDWRGRDESDAFERWRSARRKWAGKHGWHRPDLERLAEEKHLAARILERRLAQCTDEGERDALFRAYHAEHVQGLQAARIGACALAPGAEVGV